MLARSKKEAQCYEKTNQNCTTLYKRAEPAAAPPACTPALLLQYHTTVPAAAASALVTSLTARRAPLHCQSGQCAINTMYFSVSCCLYDSFSLKALLLLLLLLVLITGSC